MAYRQKKNSDIWHWCKNCTNYLRQIMKKELQSRTVETSVPNVYQKKKRKSVKNRILSRVIPLPGCLIETNSR